MNISLAKVYDLAKIVLVNLRRDTVKCFFFMWQFNSSCYFVIAEDRMTYQELLFKFKVSACYNFEVLQYRTYRLSRHEINQKT